METLAHGPGVDHPVGGLLTSQGRDVRAHRHPRGPLERGRERRQAHRPVEHDLAPAVHAPLPRGPATTTPTAGTTGADRVCPPSAWPADLRSRPRGFATLTVPACRST